MFHRRKWLRCKKWSDRISAADAREHCKQMCTVLWCIAGGKRAQIDGNGNTVRCQMMRNTQISSITFCWAILWWTFKQSHSTKMLWNHNFVFQLFGLTVKLLYFVAAVNKNHSHICFGYAQWRRCIARIVNSHISNCTCLCRFSFLTRFDILIFFRC